MLPINTPNGSVATLTAVAYAMRRHERFRRSWDVYEGTLERGADGTAFSKVDPARYFNMRMLEREGLRLRFFLGLSNDFVGLGLIFTFLGLVAGLYFASRSMMSAERGLSPDGTKLTSAFASALARELPCLSGAGAGGDHCAVDGDVRRRPSGATHTLIGGVRWDESKLLHSLRFARRSL